MVLCANIVVVAAAAVVVVVVIIIISKCYWDIKKHIAGFICSDPVFKLIMKLQKIYTDL